ncbi:hypothetical protein [Frankia sp. Cas3]|uniref:hypothetical protein n=1 Tax=Frankia sp. Cas3 TaxID=3073926 RepID=UPI002AD29DF9|nr:hypothetical protein [Frankia sp. Cas3]
MPTVRVARVPRNPAHGVYELTSVTPAEVSRAADLVEKSPNLPSGIVNTVIATAAMTA